MDLAQKDHLKAYGIAYWILTQGINVEWLLNYRGGSFMLDEFPAITKEARIRGVTVEPMDDQSAIGIYAEVDAKNMEVVLLEKALGDVRPKLHNIAAAPTWTEFRLLLWIRPTHVEEKGV